eukprot:scaffold127459_cov75-Phaeocystis_antarctica.AAC.2
MTAFVAALAMNTPWTGPCTDARPKHTATPAKPNGAPRATSFTSLLRGSRRLTSPCRPAAWLAPRPLRSAAAAAARLDSRADRRRGGGGSTSARGRARRRSRDPSARRAAPRPPAPARESARSAGAQEGRAREGA